MTTLAYVAALLTFQLGAALTDCLT
jgi:hypothetical protein